MHLAGLTFDIHSITSYLNFQPHKLANVIHVCVDCCCVRAWRELWIYWFVYVFQWRFWPLQWRVLLGADRFLFSSSLCIHTCQCGMNRLKGNILFGKFVCSAVKWISKVKQNWTNSVYETGTFQTVRAPFTSTLLFPHMFRFCFFSHIISQFCARCIELPHEKCPSLQQQQHGSYVSMWFYNLIYPLRTGIQWFKNPRN